MKLVKKKINGIDTYYINDQKVDYIDEFNGVHIFELLDDHYDSYTLFFVCGDKVVRVLEMDANHNGPDREELNCDYDFLYTEEYFGEK